MHMVDIGYACIMHGNLSDYFIHSTIGVGTRGGGGGGGQGGPGTLT